MQYAIPDMQYVMQCNPHPNPSHSIIPALKKSFSIDITYIFNVPKAINLNIKRKSVNIPSLSLFAKTK